MKQFNWIFSIVEEKNCPLYQIGERLLLTDKTLLCPQGKEVCLILVRDMTQLLFQFLDERDDGAEKDVKYNCSGCTGIIKFSPCSDYIKIDGGGSGEAAASKESVVKKVLGKNISSPFFRALPLGKTDSILSYFEPVSLDDGTILIRKSEQNKSFYLVLEGELLIEDGATLQETLTAGEFCGEMSCFGSDVAVATVKAVGKTEVLAVAGDIFGRIMEANVSVLSFITQSLAKRLRKLNTVRARDFESCMKGRLDEIVPAELFQVFHMHQKTGVLAMDLPNGKGKVSFREGCLINANYAGEENQDAIFKLLAERKGFYSFTTGLAPKEMKAAEIGDFMMLLMEGVKRVDEESGLTEK